MDILTKLQMPLFKRRFDTCVGCATPPGVWQCHHLSKIKKSMRTLRCCAVNQRHWRSLNVATTSCAQWTHAFHAPYSWCAFKSIKKQWYLISCMDANRHTTLLDVDSTSRKLRFPGGHIFSTHRIHDIPSKVSPNNYISYPACRRKYEAKSAVYEIIYISINNNTLDFSLLRVVGL